MANDDLVRTLEEVVSGMQGAQNTMQMFSSASMAPFGGAVAAQQLPTVPVFIAPQAPILPAMVQQPAAAPNPAYAVNPTQYGMPQQAPPMGMQAPPQFSSAPMPVPPPPPMMPPMMPMNPMGMQMGGFQGGMMAAQQNQISNPMMAMYMSQQGGLMPDANMMMASQYGNLRQDVLMDRRATIPLGVPGGGGGVPNALLPFDMFQRTRPELQFARPFDAALYRGTESSRLLEQGFNAYAQNAAGNVVNMAAMPAFMGIGAAAGGFLAGPGGAMQGAELGMAASQFARHIPGVTDVTQAAMRPALERRADAIQMQYASRQFLLGGGGDTDISGTGLSTGASQRLTRKFDDIAQSSQGNLNRRDLTTLMQAGGEQGLLDWAQNVDQISGTVKTMSKVLGTFAEITGDPDFMNNIKKMGALSRMGIGLTDMDTAMRNMDQYARMAGMDVDQMMQNEGLQGAQMFKAAGLGAGLGMQNRMFGAAQARQMVAGGAFTEEQLDLYGGTEGVGQTMTEINAAYLSRVSQPLMAGLVRRGEGGRMEIDAARARRISSGEVSYDEALREAGSADLSPRDMADMISSMKELTTELGRTMGPEGVQRAALQSAITMSQQSGGQLSVRAAAQTIFGEAGGAIIGRMGDPEYQRGILQQMEAEQRRREFEADKAQRQGPGSPGFLAKHGIDIEGPTARIARAQTGWSDWMASLEEDRRLAAVGVTRYERGVDMSGYTNTRALRGGEGGTGDFRSDTVSGPLGALAGLATGPAGMLAGALGVDPNRNIGRLDAALGGYGAAGLAAAGGAIDETTSVFGDERAMSRYLRGGTGAFGLNRVAGTISDLARDPLGAGMMMANPLTMGLGVAAGIGQATGLIGGESTEERRRRDAEGARAYRLAFGDEEGVAGGRASLVERFGATGVSDAAAQLASGQGTLTGSEMGDNVLNYAMMVNPITGVAGMAMAGARAMGFQPGETGMTDSRLADALGISEEEVAQMSPEEKGALMQEATLGMTNEQRAKFETEARDIISAGEGERIGKQYLRSGQGAMRRMNQVLGEAGLDDYDDMSTAERGALQQLTGKGTEESRKYLAIAALQETGDTENMQLAMRLYGELKAADPAAAKKLRRAKDKVASMNEDERDALVAMIPGVMGGKEGVDELMGLSGADAMKKMEENLGRIQEAGEGAAAVERFAETQAALSKQDLSLAEGVTDDLSLALRISGASAEDRKQFVEVLGEEAVKMAEDRIDEMQDPESTALDEFAKITATATGAGRGAVEVSKTKGARSEATDEQGANISEQRAFFGQLNAATRGNTGAVRGLTSALRENTQAMTGGSAEGEKNKARGSGGGKK